MLATKDIHLTLDSLPKGDVSGPLLGTNAVTPMAAKTLRRRQTAAGVFPRTIPATSEKLRGRPRL